MSGLAPSYRNIVAALRLFPASVPTSSVVPQLRTRASAWISRWRLPLPVDIHRQESSAGWTIFEPATTAGHVFYLHGGGLVFYSVDDFSSFMAYLASTSSCTVTGFQYDKAPEHGPHQIVDQIASTIGQRLAEIPSEAPVFLAGDSIGGYIALLLALRRFPGIFRRLVLIYPVLDLHQQRPSYQRYGRGYCLNADMMMWFQSLWHKGDGLLDFHPFQLQECDLGNLPETLVVSAEMDVLRDEAFEWCSGLRDREMPVLHQHMPMLAHDFCLYAGAVPEAKAAIDLIAAYLRPAAARNGDS
jgi:acetyl esterase/lipase